MIDIVHINNNITIIHGDCRELSSIDCDIIITDPPYGINHPCNFADRRSKYDSGKRNNWPNVYGDDQPFDPAWLLDLQKPMVLWGGNYFADKLPVSNGWLVWDKERSDNLDQATCELAWTNCVKGVRRFRHHWDGMMKASERGESYHPTQKPVALFDWILSLRWLSNVQTVFDPYMGSGPCGVACVRAGQRYIGVEINKEYFDTAYRRITKELSQLQFNFNE